LGLLLACSPLPNLTVEDTQVLAEAAQTDLALTGSLLDDTSPPPLTLDLPVPVLKIFHALTNASYQEQSECNTDLNPKDPTDSDLDGIPALVTVNFDCSWISGGNENGTTHQITGEATIEDNDDTQAGSGFEVAFADFRTLATHPNTLTRDRLFNGSVAVDKTTLGCSIELDYSLAIQVTKGDTRVDGTVSYQLNKTYLADDPVNLWLAGTLVSTGTIDHVSDAGTHSLAFATEPSLHWNLLSCQEDSPLMNFDDGAIRYLHTRKDGVINTFLITFSSCGEFSTTYDGIGIDL
jgi:hypothetical protein